MSVKCQDWFGERTNERPTAGDPALKTAVGAPHACEQDSSNQHDSSILDQAETSPDPIGLDSNGDLANDNADNLQLISHQIDS